MNTLSRRVLSCLFVLAFFVGLPIIQAQLPTGTILGVVHDSSGAAVPGASVTARETETNQARTATSGGDGGYRFDALPIGSYEITVKATGFGTIVQTGLTLTVGQEAVENFTLQVGSVSQTVSVTAEAANLVSTTTSSLSTLVTPQTIDDLPLNGRNYITLTLLQPGVTVSVNSGSPTAGYSGTEFSANGAPFRSNTYLLDGAILNNMVNANGASATGTTLGVDGIQEYSVLTNGYSAEYGFSMGAQQVIVSKGGTNSFHGDVFEYLRNSALDSRNYFDLPPSRLGHRLPEFRRNQFGGSVGGPIQKDKTFFFATFEGLRSSQGLTETSTTLAAGCHGAAGAVITDTACPQIAPTASVAIAAPMAPVIGLWPLPNLPNNQYGQVFQQVVSEDYGQVRVDHTFSSSDSMFARYTIDRGSLPLFEAFNEWTLIDQSTNQFATLAENHVFSPNLVNTARISYSGSPIGQTAPINDPRLLLPAYQMEPPEATGGISPGTVTGVGRSTASISRIKSAIWSGSDDLDYNRDRHAMKFGFIFNFQRDNTFNLGYTAGSATMNGVLGLLTGAMTTFAGLVGPSGLPPYANVPAGPPIGQRVVDFVTMGFYVQDSWKITPRLTLNGGMRYEPMTTVNEIHGYGYAIRHPLTDTSWTKGPLFRNASLRNLGPRVGFAWDVFGDGKTSLRGGFGIYYDLSSMGGSLTLNGEDTPPYSNQFTLSGGILTFPYVEPVAGSGAFLQQANGINYNWNQPHLLGWNLAAERQLPGQIGLTVAYAGSRGLNIEETEDVNPVIPTGVPSANGGTSCVAAPVGSTPITLAQASAPTASQIDGSATSCYLTNSPRANPALYSITLGTPGGNSIYNALQVNVVKHITHGLQFHTSYTWGRVQDSGYGLAFFDFGHFIREPLIPRANRAVADQNIEQALNIDMIYHIPGVSEKNSVLSEFANGWYVTPIAAAYTGHPFSLTMGGNRQLTGNRQSAGTPQTDPDVLAGRTSYNITHGVSSGCGTGANAIAVGTPLHTPTRWYDPCAFSIAPLGFVGTEPRNLLIGPGLVNLDFAIVKDTKVSKLGEGGNIEFRSEFFNVLNHTNFGLPVATLATASCGGSILACGFGASQAVASTAGVIQATNGNARQIQFAVKIVF